MPYVDLILLHQCYNDVYGSWRALERIYKEGKPAVEDYFKFLSSGGSDSPVELLKLAGVDLTKRDAFDAAMNSFEDALNQFIALNEQK